MTAPYETIDAEESLLIDRFVARLTAHRLGDVPLRPSDILRAEYFITWLHDIAQSNAKRAAEASTTTPTDEGRR